MSHENTLKRKNISSSTNAYSILNDLDDDDQDTKNLQLYNVNEDDNDGFEVVGKMDKDIRKKRKKDLKSAQKRITLQQGTRDDYLLIYGEQTRPTIEIAESFFPPQPCDISSLILSVLMDFQPPKNVALKFKPLLRKVVLIQLDGFTYFSACVFKLLHSFADKSKSKFPKTEEFIEWCKFITTLNGKAMPLLFQSSLFSPCGIAASILNVPGFILEFNKKIGKKFKNSKNLEEGLGLTATLATTEENEEKTEEKVNIDCLTKMSLNPSELFTLPNSYLLSLTEIQELNFPTEDLEEYVSLPKPIPDENGNLSEPRLFAIDCEMCRSPHGLELTRISVVNSNLECLYDKLVMPDNVIVDYCTKYSGITPELLEGVTLKLNEVIDDLGKIMTSNDILIGHSLENDLHVMKLKHFYIIDTSVIYPHPRGLPYRYSLKNLTSSFLDMAIQQGSHDSTIDARVAMMLVLLKLKKGPTFGLSLREEENLLLMLTKARKQVEIIGYPDLIQHLAPSTVSVSACFNDSDIEEKAIKACKSNTDFCYIQFGSFLKLNKSTTHIEILEMGEELNNRLLKIEQSLPSDSLVVYVTGQPPLNLLNDLTTKKMNAKKSGYIWSEDDDSTLNNATEAVKHGLSWIKIT